MPARQPKKAAGSRSSRRRTRTDGAPRLVEPGGPNNRDGTTWAIVWSDAGRSKRFRTDARDEDAARLALQAFLNAKAALAFHVTVNQVLDADIARIEQEHAANRRRPALLAARKSALRPVRAHFGALAPENLSRPYVASYAEKRRSEGVSDRTISIELAYLRAALNKALEAGRISAAPKITLPQGKARARRRVLTKGELARFIKAAMAPETPLHLRGFVMLSLHTGQRSVHVKALRWEHVDFEDGMLLFTRSNPDAAENKQCADMPITKGLAPVLTELRAAARTEFVIEWNDAPVEGLRTSFAKLTQRAGLDDFNVHDIRRSFATLGAMKDIDIKALANLMNVDEATLRAHYAHGVSQKTRALIESIGGEE